MENLNKNKTYINLLKQNGYNSYAKLLENNEELKYLQILEDFIKIITKNKNSDEIKDIRKRYIKRFERKNI
ncbi:MAG: hypothetical protein RBR08_01010 [Desulforegulaceae bacterium]|nr:hypothetical protein [Desulforegulaceae bacterium]